MSDQNVLGRVANAVKGAYTVLRASLSDPDQKLLKAMTDGGLGGWRSMTNAGITVTEKTALSLPAYFAAVKIIAESVGMLPLELYERTDNGKRKATDHPVYDLLHLRPNPFMSSSVFREATTAHMVSWGRSDSRIVRERGRIVAIYPLLPDRTTTKFENGAMWFETEDADHKPLPPLDPADVLHHIGLSFDGIHGYTLFQFFKETVAGAKAVEDFGNLFFKNGSHIGGVVEHPSRIKDDPSYARLKKSLDDKYQGLGKSHELMILENGMKYQKIGVNPADAQAIETKQHSLLDFCRITRIPPHMLAYLKDATFSNVEHMGIEFLKFTMAPILNRMAQEYTYKLLDLEERQRYFIAFNLNGYMLGDSKARSEFYHQMLIDGVFNADDVLDLEDRNRQPNGLGQKYYIPLNMIEKGASVDVISSTRQRSIAEPHEHRISKRERQQRSVAMRRRIAGQYLPKIQAAATRILKLELAQLRTGADEHLKKRSADDFKLWLEDFYEEFQQTVRDIIAPTILSYANELKPVALEEAGSEEDIDATVDEFASSYADNYAYRHIVTSRATLKGLLNDVMAKKEAGEEVNEYDAVADRLDTWESERAEDIAREESTTARAAISKAIYAAVGVRYIISVSDGQNCPYCDALDGKTIGIEQTFLSKGEEFQPDGASSPLTVTRNLSHPAYHVGCDCDIAIA